MPTRQILEGFAKIIWVGLGMVYDISNSQIPFLLANDKMGVFWLLSICFGCMIGILTFLSFQFIGSFVGKVFFQNFMDLTFFIKEYPNIECTLGSSFGFVARFAFSAKKKEILLDSEKSETCFSIASHSHSSR